MSGIIRNTIDLFALLSKVTYYEVFTLPRTELVPAADKELSFVCTGIKKSNHW